jgi:O-antigen/teichoic acid export membrane protein
MIAFLLLPVFTHYLTPADYGISALIIVFTTLLNGLFSLGAAASIGIYYFEAAEGPERAKVIWTTAALLLANCALLTLLGFVFSPQLSLWLFKSPDHSYLIRLALVTLSLSTLTIPFLAFLQLEERAKTYVLFTSVSSLLTLLLSVVTVVYLRHGIAGLFEASLMGIAVLLAGTVLIAFLRLKPGLDFSRVWPVIRTGFPSIFGVGAFFFIDWSDRLLIERFLGLDELGVYSIGYSFGMLMSLVVMAFGNAWPPYFISFINKREEAAVLFAGVLKYYVILLGTVTLALFLLARPVVITMTAPPFHGAFTIVGLVALSYMLKGCYLIMLPPLVYEKRLYLQSGIEWVAAGLNVGLNLLLIPVLRKEGAAIATLMAYFSLPLVTYFVGAMYMRVSYDWKNIAKFAVGFIVLAVWSYFPVTSSPSLSFAISLLSLILALLYVLYVPLSSRERAAIFKLLATAKNRLLHS